ncbi:MAG: hypothetical protein ACR2OF_00610 [Hyphomicrobium sp.]
MTLLAVGVAVGARLAVGAVGVAGAIAVVEVGGPSGAVEAALTPLEAVEAALTPLEAVEAVLTHSVVGEVPGINSVH